MKRKTLVLFMTILLSLSLVGLSACGNGSSGSNNADSTEEDEEMVEGADEDMEEGEDLDAEAAETDEEESGEADADAESGEETTVSGIPPTEILGVSTDSNYTNDYFGITFNPPADTWYVATEAERGQVLGLTSELLSQDEAMANVLESVGYAMDLYALDISQTGNNDTVNITIQDIGKVFGAMYTEQQIVDTSLDQAKAMLESQGWTVETENTEMDFCGSPSYCTKFTCTMEDQTVYQTQVYIKKESYFGAVTAASYGEDKTDEFLSWFSAI